MEFALFSSFLLVNANASTLKCEFKKQNIFKVSRCIKIFPLFLQRETIFVTVC